MSDAFVEKDPMIVADGSCCSFRVGQRCPVSNDLNQIGEFRTFEGLMDEIAVWNRQLRPEEVKNPGLKKAKKTFYFSEQAQ